MNDEGRLPSVSLKLHARPAIDEYPHDILPPSKHFRDRDSVRFTDVAGELGISKNLTTNK